MTDKLASPSDPHSNSRYYFFGPVIDYFLAGGLSILFYFFIKAYIGQDPTPGWVFYLSGILLWIGNWPHFAATNVRLYGSMATIKQYPLTATIVPIIIFGGMYFSLNNPVLIAPYFVKVFLIWSPYHFSGQTVGVTLIYARRAGYIFNTIERKALSFFIFGTFLYGTAKAEISSGTYTYYDIKYPAFGIPSWTPQIIAPIMWAAFLITVIAFFKKSYSNKKLFPLIILVPSIAQFIWFVKGSSIAGYTEFVPFFHSIQYLLVATSMQLVEQVENSEDKPSRIKLSFKMIKWGLIIVGLGAILFSVLPNFISSYGIPLSLALGVSAAAVQIHHFFVDGVIWKLKRKTVSQPLMLNAKQVFKSLS